VRNPNKKALESLKESVQPAANWLLQHFRNDHPSAVNPEPVKAVFIRAIAPGLKESTGSPIHPKGFQESLSRWSWTVMTGDIEGAHEALRETGFQSLRRSLSSPYLLRPQNAGRLF
jgi:hypothetical protein